MKQQITKKQWDELSDKEKIKIMSFFDKSFLGDEENLTEGFYIPYKIGRLIEFLGDDLYAMKFISDKEWFIETEMMTKIGVEKEMVEEELIDALWEAVKYKLKNNII